MARPNTEPALDASERFLSGLAFLAAVVLVLAVPLVWDIGALDMFRGPKSALALAGWAVLAAVFLTGNPGGAAWRDSWWLAWGGVVAGGVASALACPQPARALTALVPLALAGAGWGAVRQLPEARRRTLATLVVWAGVVEAALTLLFLPAPWRPRSFALLAQEGGRYLWIGSLGNPADVAIFLALPAILAAVRAVALRRHRLANGAAAVFMAVVILGTQTLTAVLALASGFLVLLWRGASPRSRLPLVAAALAVVVAVFAATPLSSRVRMAIRQTQSGGLLWLGSARFAAYAAGASMVGARPATGIGFGLWEANSFRYQSPEALAERGRILGLETAFGEAHNDILQYLAETGLAGFLLGGAGIAWAAHRRRRGEGVVGGVWPLATTALVLVLTQFPLHLAPVAAQWAILTALLLPPLPAPRSSGVWMARSRVLVAGVLIGAAGVVDWQLYRVDRLCQQAKVLSATLRASQGPPQRRADIARAALANLLPRTRWVPYSWSAALIAGNLAVDAGNAQLALSSFDRALRLAERPEVQFDVGIALHMAGDSGGATDHLVQAVQLNPAIFREIRDPGLARAVRRRLEASGYGARHGWMFEGSAAADP